ncbi:MAG TPA: Crp/Fnr family transcriptional regulator [Hyphomicrobiales bacterium]|nr:Crp/Fnr family transcriptional regulator [Hyphomicrobiales bacterium]
MSELLIRKLELRDHLSAEEKQIIRDMVGPARLVRSDFDIVCQGDHPSESTLLLEGFTFRSVYLKDGQRQITSIHVPGDFVDLHCFLIKQMDHNITALTPCRIAKVPHATLQRISETQPHLTRMFWLSTLIDAAIHRRWLAAMGRQSALAHAAHLLCELYVRQNEIGLVDGASFRAPLTQVKLADALGLSHVHTNRVVQELRERRLVEWLGDRVTVLDWDGLAGLAEFDPTYLSLCCEPR